jgi:MerR family transcriptional regulator, light-induced transcriptional regulator
MSPTLLSTRDVAHLLNVTETTIKRWADSGEIACVKTLGGHRKYTRHEILRFSEANGIPVTGFAGIPGGKNTGRLAFAVQSRDFSLIAGELFALSKHHDPEQIHGFLSFLVTHQIAPRNIADDIVRPALIRVGDEWAAGRISIEQEHMISEAILHAIARITPELHHKKSNGLTAICACAEGEHHSIGVRWLTAALEADGWKVVFVGSNTPFRGITALLGSVRPELVCISVMKIRDDQEWVSMFREVGDAARRCGAKFLVGGMTVSEQDGRQIGCDHISRSIADGIAFVRESFHLKPGPRKKTHA